MYLYTWVYKKIRMIPDRFFCLIKKMFVQCNEILY